MHGHLNIKYVVITCIWGGGGKRGNSVYIIKVESASLFKIYMALRKEGYWKEETVKAPFSDVVYLSCR